MVQGLGFKAKGKGFRVWERNGVQGGGVSESVGFQASGRDKHY